MPWEDQKRFMEEMILRFEKAFQRVDRSMAAQQRRIDANTDALNALITRFDAHTEDFKAESRAQRQALLHVLDELKGRPDGGSAAA